MLFALVSCSDDETSHSVCVDGNGDFRCDECGANINLKHTECFDADGDLNCDECGKALPADTNDYNVRFFIGDELYSEMTLTLGVSADLPVPQLNGYSFIGWCTSDGERWEAGTHDGEDIDVYAELNIITYTITYHIGRADAINQNPTEYTVKSADFEIAEPVSEGDVFLGWYKDSAFTEPMNLIIEKGSTGDIVMYAKWDCSHDYSLIERADPSVFEDGRELLRCDKCGLEKENVIPATRTVKLLAIGNSFSIDALEHFCKILSDGGVETIIVANLYKSGCSIDGHLANIESGVAEYTLYRNNSDNLMVSQSEKVTLADGLRLERWDIITMQQASGKSGNPKSYAGLGELIEYVRGFRPDAKLYWHMTWAYDSWHLGEGKSYENSISMHAAILNAVSEKIVGNENFVKIIPSGTAIQNIRSSYLGDNLTRDGYHLSYGIGRYTAALTWYGLITGKDTDLINWTPSKYPEVAEHLTVIKEAVKAALFSPYSVTESAYPPDNTADPDEGGDDITDTPITPKPPADSVGTLVDLTAADISYLTSKGYDPSGYKRLVLEFHENRYYNSTSSSRLTTGTESNGLINKFFATNILTRSELTVGSLIRITDGYRYRAEGWVDLGTKNSSSTRPGNVSSELTLVDDAWWGSFFYRAFNVSRSGSTVSAQDFGVLTIYVPISEQ